MLKFVNQQLNRLKKWLHSNLGNIIIWSCLVWGTATLSVEFWSIVYPPFEAFIELLMKTSITLGQDGYGFYIRIDRDYTTTIIGFDAYTFHIFSRWFTKVITFFYDLITIENFIICIQLFFDRPIFHLCALIFIYLFFNNILDDGSVAEAKAKTKMLAPEDLRPWPWFINGENLAFAMEHVDFQDSTYVTLKRYYTDNKYNLNPEKLELYISEVNLALSKYYKSHPYVPPRK